MAYPSQQPQHGSPSYDQPTEVQPVLQPPRPQRGRRTAIIALAAAIALVAAGTGAYWFGFSDITIEGSITLTAGGTGYGNTECHGTGPYADLTGGAQIEVTDGAGKTVGLGKLGPGKVTDDKGCLFSFAVKADRADFYVLKLGRMGGIKMSRAEAEDGVALKLGAS